MPYVSNQANSVRDVKVNVDVHMQLGFMVIFIHHNDGRKTNKKTRNMGQSPT